jgi:transcriptional regulator with XRE-family HTH domain
MLVAVAGPGGADETDEYARLLGQRMRDVRREVGLTLLQVGAVSGGMFKASVVGAYERGERSITVQRLEQLAQYYGVPTWRMLPRSLHLAHPGASAGGVLTLDLAALRERSGHPYDALTRYVGHVLDERGEPQTRRTLSVRSDERSVVATLIDADVDELFDRLDELGVLRTSPR